MTGLEYVSIVQASGARGAIAVRYITSTTIWDPGKKVNGVKLTDVDAFFNNSKVGSDIKYFQYHDTLQFIGFLSPRAIAWRQQGQTPTRAI